MEYMSGADHPCFRVLKVLVMWLPLFLLAPPQNSCFLRGGSTVDQAIMLTQNIENCSEAKRKVGAVFIDLIAAYDSVRHHGRTSKLLRFLP